MFARALQGCPGDAQYAPGDRGQTSSRAHQLLAQRQPSLLVQATTEQGEPPQGMQVPRLRPRGAVEAPEQADSQRVDLARQNYGGYTQIACFQNEINII